MDDNDSKTYLPEFRSEDSLTCMCMLDTDIHRPAYNSVLSISSSSSGSLPTKDAKNISSIPSVTVDNLNQLFDHGQSQVRRCSSVHDRHSLLSLLREDRIARSEPYHIRACNPDDFASVWEKRIVPMLLRQMEQHQVIEYAAQVHTFPEATQPQGCYRNHQTAASVLRVIYITICVPEASGCLTSHGSPSKSKESNREPGIEEVDPVWAQELEQSLRIEIENAVPAEKFRHLYVRVEFLSHGLMDKLTWW